MRQIPDVSTTPENDNASTCGFFARKCRCVRGFQNLPHTSVSRFRKCGENPRPADQTTFSHFRDLRFCCKKSCCARRFPIFPRTSVSSGKTKCPKTGSTTKNLPENSPLNAKTAFRRFTRTKPDVPSQGLIKPYSTKSAQS